MDDNRRHVRRGIMALLFCAVCGCTFPSMHPADPPLPNADTVSHWQAPQAPGGTAKADGAQPLLAPRPFPANEQFAQMSQRIASVEDDRKTLATRLQMVEAQLDEKEKALAAATREIQEATAQVVRTRNDLQQWKKDMAALRDKLGSMDKEHRDTLEAIIRTLEQVIEQDRAPTKAIEGGPELMPMPKNSGKG